MTFHKILITNRDRARFGGIIEQLLVVQGQQIKPKELMIIVTGDQK